MEASLVGRLLMLTALPYSLLAEYHSFLLGALNGQRTSFGIQSASNHPSSHVPWSTVPYLGSTSYLAREMAMETVILSHALEGIHDG